MRNCMQGAWCIVQKTALNLACSCPLSFHQSDQFSGFISFLGIFQGFISFLFKGIPRENIGQLQENQASVHPFQPPWRFCLFCGISVCCQCLCLHSLWTACLFNQNPNKFTALVLDFLTSLKTMFSVIFLHNVFVLCPPLQYQCPGPPGKPDEKRTSASKNRAPILMESNKGCIWNRIDSFDPWTKEY